MSTYDDASLILYPSGYKEDKLYSLKPTDGSGDLDFTRASTATRVNEQGLIEGVRTNLILHSEDWTNAAWTKTQNTVTANATTNPINAANTADAIFETTISSQHNFFQVFSTSTGTEITISFYAKANGRTKLRMNNGSSGLTAAFDLTAVTASMLVGTGTPTITFVSSGWYRCSIRFNALGSTQYVAMNFRDDSNQDIYAGDITKGMFFFGAQAESGVLTEYIPTTTTAVSVGMLANVPRIDYTGGGCGKLLLEGQRTNLALYSEQFDNAYWVKTNTSVTANATTSPDGTSNADELIESVTTTIHYLINSPSVAANASTYYTASYFVKYNGRHFQILGSTGSEGGGYVNFDLLNGVVGNSDQLTGTIEAFANGWYRCTGTNVSTAVATEIRLLPYLCTSPTSARAESYLGNGTSGIYIYGAQVEAGAYATSYIPTLASSVTRLADAASKTGISSLIGQTEGVMFIDLIASSYNADGTSYSLLATLGNSSENFQIYTYNALLSYNITASGVVDASTGITLINGGRYKIAIAYKSGDSAVFVNGALTNTTTKATLPTAANLYLNEFSNGTYKSSNSFNQAILFPTRLTNDQLADLTGGNKTTFNALAEFYGYTIL